MTTLWIDAGRGISARDLLGALLDLGVPPSPILRALGALELPVELRLAPGRVDAIPEGASMLVPIRGLRALLDRAGAHAPAPLRVAEDALGRLLLAEARQDPGLEACVLLAQVDAAALACVVGASVALDLAGASEIIVSRVGVPSELSPPLVELLGDAAEVLDFGAGATTTTDGAALLRAVAPVESLGQDEPRWRGAPQRGACGGVRVAIGTN